MVERRREVGMYGKLAWRFEFQLKACCSLELISYIEGVCVISTSCRQD
jgi:hypothetical protein